MAPTSHPTTDATEGPRRFLTLADVADILATSVAQVRALVQSGELRYIQIGGRQQYRIEAVELENYIQRMYAKVEESRRLQSRGPDVPDSDTERAAATRPPPGADAR